ncbi:MAG TPA: tripartite tricarboxylate transporter substrate binding protein [Burkholderiales bacterium]|nr:tripartite tricarboxylate transporter substrate binding protein [Burkholderiales bacterium]
MDSPRAVCLSLLLTLSVTATAQEYPNRPVRVVDPFSPGGSTDVLARIVGQKLTERLGQPFLVENRAGGGGHIGADLVAKAPPNGYMLLVAGVPHAIGMTLYRKLPYDMAKDLQPITQMATFPSLIVVHPSLPVKNIRELVALAKARPGELNFGANPGSPNHLSIELLNTMAKVKMVFVGYKGAAPAVTDVVAGQIQVVSAGFPSVLGYVQAGRLRPIAVTSTTRSPLLPNVPTVSESGVPGYNVTSWYGIFGPVGTPAAAVGKLQSEITTVLKAPDVGERLASLGAQPAPTTPEELGRIVREEVKRWAQVVKISGATVN